MEPANRISSGIFGMLTRHVRMVHGVRLSQAVLGPGIWHYFYFDEGHDTYKSFHVLKYLSGLPGQPFWLNGLVDLSIVFSDLFLNKSANYSPALHPQTHCFSITLCDFEFGPHGDLPCFCPLQGQMLSFFLTYRISIFTILFIPRWIFW